MTVDSSLKPSAKECLFSVYWYDSNCCDTKKTISLEINSIIFCSFNIFLLLIPHSFQFPLCLIHLLRLRVFFVCVGGWSGVIDCVEPEIIDVRRSYSTYNKNRINNDNNNRRYALIKIKHKLNVENRNNLNGKSE